MGVSGLRPLNELTSIDASNTLVSLNVFEAFTMPATTLKLPPELKKRVASIVDGTNQSAHAFMLQAIDAQTTLAERRKAFLNEALVAERAALKTGKGYFAHDVDAYFDAKLAGKKAVRPKAKKWRE
jgi:predicted transcriptional regulator